MIQLTDITLQRGTKILLDQANLTVYEKQKWGLIGANGAGKSSLFKLLLKELHEDAGSLSIPKHWRLAHMAQEAKAHSGTAIDYVIDGDDEFRQLQRDIENAGDDGEKLANHYEKMEAIDGYTIESRAHALLNGLGFESSDGKKLSQHFSGGWRIRLNLARALMCRSDLLLLDEPTNHLDLDATIWLEQWLRQYPGTLVIISHDRDFLDNVISHTANIEKGKLHSYTGNYSSFELQKAERLAQQAAAFEKQQARIADIENFVRRFRAKATKAKQAQSRLKELERMEKIAPAHIDSPFSFRFPCADKTSQLLINLSEADIGYERPILKKCNFSILENSRIGLLGHNGAGKSTLLKALANEVALLNGERNEGTHSKPAYFAQHQLEALDLNASCALHIQRVSPKATEQEIRNFLGGFAFHGDRVFETIQHFSGGEKARLALALVAWQSPNVLLLDEPTNHLDLEMCHALTLALQEYSGAIVLISHDRHLLRNTVDEFVLVNEGKVEEFDGDLDDYEVWLRENKSAGTKDYSESEVAVEAPALKDKKAQRQASAQQRAVSLPLRKKLREQEKQMLALQKKLEKIEETLADPELYTDDSKKAELAEALKTQGLLRQSIDECEEIWLETSEKIEALEGSEP